MREGIAYGGLPVPIPDVYNGYVSDMSNVWNTVFTFIHLPWMFLLTEILNKGLDKIQWASFISHLHAKLRIVSWKVPGFASCSPCSVWSHG